MSEKIDKMHKVLKEAKKHLSKDKYSPGNTSCYICNCVEKIKAPMELKDKVLIYVNDLLQNYSSLYTWILLKYPELEEELYDDYLKNGKKLQETRFVWINWMINDLKSKNL